MIIFPPEAVDTDTIITHKLRLWTSNYDLRPLAAYDLTATTLEGTPVNNFNKEILIQLQYSYEDLPEWLERSIAGFIWNEKTETWDYVSTALDTDKNLAQFRTRIIGFHVAQVTGLGSLKIAGSGPDTCNSPFMQPTPTRINNFIVDIPNILGHSSTAEIEQTLGPSLQVSPLESEGDIKVYGKGEIRSYRVDDYIVLFVFDENGKARGFQLYTEYAHEKYSIDDWSLLLSRLNLHPAGPDAQFSSSEFLFFSDINGYDLLVLASPNRQISQFIIAETGVISP
jgi:hypothetical protein